MSIQNRLPAHRGARDDCTGLLYVVNQESGTLNIIDTATATLLKSLPIGNMPSQVISDPDEGKLFIVTDDGLNVIHDGEIVGTMPFDGYSSETHGAYLPDTHLLYLAMKQSNAVNVYDTDTYQLLTTIPVGDTPLSIAADAATGKVYVYSYHSSNISVIDGATNTVTETIGTGAATLNDMIVDNGVIYAATTKGLTIMDEASGATLDTFAVDGSGLDHIAYDPTLNLIYGTNELWTKGVIIDPDAKTIDEAPLPSYYHGGITVDTDEGLAYFTNGRDNSITVVDGATRSVVDTIPTDGGMPLGIAYECAAQDPIPGLPLPPLPVYPTGPIKINARVMVCCNVDVDGLFDVVLANEAGTVVARETNDAGGHVVFNLPALPPGQYHYTMYEDPGVAGFRQDDRKIPVLITIDADGEAKITYPHNKPFFHNVVKMA